MHTRARFGLNSSLQLTSFPIKEAIMVFSELRFEKLRLLVRLGWGDEERRVPQPIDLSITIKFETPPAACETDHLDDTICYAKLSEAAREYCAERSFNLIERLGAQLFKVLREQLPSQAYLRVEVTKVSPPIAGLHGGATFTYGDNSC